MNIAIIITKSQMAVGMCGVACAVWKHADAKGSEVLHACVSQTSCAYNKCLHLHTFVRDNGGTHAFPLWVNLGLTREEVGTISV